MTKTTTGVNLQMEFDQLTLKRLQSVVRTDLGFWGEVRHLLKESADHLEGNLKKNVPIGKTHKLRSSIKQRIDASRTPLWAKVSADATSTTVRKDGSSYEFRYGWALQASKTKFIYRYQSGPKTGSKTKNWFTRSRRGLKKKQAQLLERMAARMQRRWAA